MMRLNKYLARAGIASRRKSDDLIKSGLVKVNGKVVEQLGLVIDEEKDEVEYDGHPVTLREEMVYVILNKPKEVLSTADDEFQRQTVVGLVSFPERIYPVGRLDYDTTGALLLTNDGELTNRLLHPGFKVLKVYRVLIDKAIKPIHLHQLRQGVELDGKKTLPCKMEEVRKINNQSYLQVELREGRKRQIRRMFEHLGYRVQELERVAFAGITTKGLKQGEWRFLNEDEIVLLKKEVQYEN